MQYLKLGNISLSPMLVRRYWGMPFIWIESWGWGFSSNSRILKVIWRFCFAGKESMNLFAHLVSSIFSIQPLSEFLFAFLLANRSLFHCQFCLVSPPRVLHRLHTLKHSSTETTTATGRPLRSIRTGFLRAHSKSSPKLFLASLADIVFFFVFALIGTPILDNLVNIFIATHKTRSEKISHGHRGHPALRDLFWKFLPFY